MQQPEASMHVEEKRLENHSFSIWKKDPYRLGKISD